MNELRNAVPVKPNMRGRGIAIRIFNGLSFAGWLPTFFRRQRHGHGPSPWSRPLVCWCWSIFQQSVRKMGTLGERCAQFKKLYVIYKTIIVLKRGLRFFNTIRVLETGGENMMDGSTINTRTSGNCDRGSSRQ